MKHSSPMGIAPFGSVHTVGDGGGAVDVARLSFLAAGGGAPGQPQVFGLSRHAMLTHCPARGPLVKHSSPIGIGP